MNWMPIPALGGVNLFDDPRAIQDSEVQWARNLAPIKPGILKKRGGLSRPTIAMNLLLTGVNEPTAAVICPISGSQADMVLIARQAGPGTMVGASLSSGEYASCYLPFDNPRAHLLPWNGKAYVLPGPDAAWYAPTVAITPASSGYPFYLFDSTIVGTLQAPVGLAFAGVGNANTYPRYAFPYKQRLALANFGKGYENTIVFTDNFRADLVGDNVLASNGRAISLVAGADGDEIVGGVEVMLTSVGTPAESGLLILRRYGNPFLLTGDMDQTTGGTSTLAIQRISVNCGCAGQYTIARTPVGIIWAGVDDVWCFAAGVLPHRIGQKIQPELKLTPASLQYRWTGVYHDGFYRLSVFGAGAAFDHYISPPGNTWWLDLREGLPQDWREARWWGPMQYLGHAANNGTAPVPGVFLSVPETRAGKDAKLYYVDSADTTGVPSNGITIGEYGTDTRDMTSPAAAIADKDYVDPEVTAELITKEYALAPARDQINDGLMAVIRPSNDLTLSADFVIDDGDQVITRTKRLAGPDNFRLDSSQLDQSDGSSRVTGKAIKTALYPSTRRAGQTHRFRIYDTAGYTIIAGFNDTLLVAVNAFGGTNPPQYRLTVPAGTYTIATLITALNAALLTDSGGTTHGNLLANNVGLTLVTGTVKFDDSPSPSFVNLVISFVSNALVTSAFATAADWIISRRLGAILGMDTGADQSFFGDGSTAPNFFAGTYAPFKKGIADWEIYGIAANMEVLPRTP